MTQSTPTAKKLKVVLVNHSDNNGGAAVVTNRLMTALRREGVDASMLVYTCYTAGAGIEVLSKRWIRGLHFLLERADIMLRNGFDRKNLFKVSTANYAIGIASHPLVKEADIVVLSWANQGLLSLNDLSKLTTMGKPIVWIMHDMWCMTGICHHALDCRNYLKECGNCMFLGSKAGNNDLSHKVWKKKKDAYSSSKIKFIAVSNWLKDCAQSSSLLHDKDIGVIPNAFPIETFPYETDIDTVPVDLVPDRKYILMGAARLDDPIKGLDYAIEALNILFDECPEIANNAEALFFGQLRNADALNELRFPHRYIGQIKDPTLLRKLYAAGKVVMSSSLYETLPGTLIEGQAAGCLPVTFNRGGQRDIIEHLRNGYIASFGDVRDLANGIKWALNATIDRSKLHNEVADKFSSKTIAQRYVSLFENLVRIG